MEMQGEKWKMKIYIACIQPYMEHKGIDSVTNARKKRIEAYMRAEDKARCLAAGILLRQVCGVTDDSQLCQGKNGKPYLKDSVLHFNLSHSGDYVVLATADREVGVDIEKVELYSEAVANRCFTPAEREWMGGDADSFYRLWTAKESVMKASGLGFSLSPESFSVLPIDSSAHKILDKTWFFDWIPFDRHIICRAIEGKNENTEIVRM
jgi:4'-phosphopantetheinyl transferase